MVIGCKNASRRADVRCRRLEEDMSTKRGVRVIFRVPAHCLTVLSKYGEKGLRRAHGITGMERARTHVLPGRRSLRVIPTMFV